jgi:hypothetical protein
MLRVAVRIRYWLDPACPERARTGVPLHRVVPEIHHFLGRLCNIAVEIQPFSGAMLQIRTIKRQ